MKLDDPKGLAAILPPLLTDEEQEERNKGIDDAVLGDDFGFKMGASIKDDKSESNLSFGFGTSKTIGASGSKVTPQKPTNDLFGLVNPLVKSVSALPSFTGFGKAQEEKKAEVPSPVNAEKKEQEKPPTQAN